MTDISQIIKGGAVGAAALLIAAAANACPEDACPPESVDEIHRTILRQLIPHSAHSAPRGPVAADEILRLLPHGAHDIRPEAADEIHRTILRQLVPHGAHSAPHHQRYRLQAPSEDMQQLMLDDALATLAVTAGADPETARSRARLLAAQPEVQTNVQSTQNITINDGDQKVELTYQNGEVTNVRVDGRAIDPDNVDLDDGHLVVTDDRGRVIVDMHVPNLAINAGDIQFGGGVIPNFDPADIPDGVQGGFVIERQGVPLLQDLPLLGNAFSEPRVIIGITMDEPSEDLLRHYGLNLGSATVIRDVHKGLPADRAGLRPYDLVVHVGDSLGAPMDRIRQAVQAREPGDELEVIVLRKGEHHRIQIELDEFDPENEQMRWRVEADQIDPAHEHLAEALRLHAADPEQLQNLILRLQPEMGEDGFLSIRPRMLGRIADPDADEDQFFIDEEFHDHAEDLHHMFEQFHERMEGRDREIEQRMERLERMMERLLDAQLDGREGRRRPTGLES